MATSLPCCGYVLPEIMIKERNIPFQRETNDYKIVQKINSTAARAKSLKERTIGLPHALLNIYKNENNI